MSLLAHNINSSYFKKISKKSILEVGSGDGKQLHQFKKIGFDVLGYEPSKILSDIANKNKIDIDGLIFSINFFAFDLVSIGKYRYWSTSLILFLNLNPDSEKKVNIILKFFFFFNSRIKGTASSYSPSDAA